MEEIDLQAYADGLLDSDPQRKAEVEAWLREHPGEAARIRDYTEQNTQIRAHFEPVLDEPVPSRLKNAVAPQVAVTGARRVARLGIAASLMLAVGVSGWWLGATMHGPSAQVQAFLHQAASIYRLGGYRLAEKVGPPVPKSIKVSPLDRFSERIAPELQPPDLSEQGYTLVDRGLMMESGRHAVRLIYAGPQGHRINLVWEMRWQEDEIPKLHIMEDGEVMVAYWLDGPVIYGLVGQLERDQLLALAQAARRSSRMIQDAMPKQVDTRPLSGVGARNNRLPEDTEDRHRRVDPVHRLSPAGRM